MVPPPRPAYLSLLGAAHYSSLGCRTLKRRIKEGRLPAYRVGRRVLVPADELDGLIRSRPVLAPTGPPAADPAPPAAGPGPGPRETPAPAPEPGPAGDRLEESGETDERMASHIPEAPGAADLPPTGRPGDALPPPAADPGPPVLLNPAMCRPATPCRPRYLTSLGLRGIPDDPAEDR